MDFFRVLFSLFAVGGLGLIFGVGLVLASRIFSVKKDDRVSQVEALLPGANCGACGFAGCSAYAQAIVNDEAELTLCTPGGSELIPRLGEYMGMEVEVSTEKMVAQIFCRATEATTASAFVYQGLEDCNALYAAFQGDRECPYGCLGRGSCIGVCPTQAIFRAPEGCITIDPDRCISCGKCLKVCPTGVIKWVPAGADVIVACNSRDKGGIVRKYCTVGCIGCKICEKKSPEGGFWVENFLAEIDYSKGGDRIAGKDACPAKCIVFIRGDGGPSEGLNEEKSINEEN